MNTPQRSARAPEATLRRGPIVSAGILLGTGLGGFVDGILLHQILQWHNMLSSLRPPTDLVAMKYNMIWDGLFHAFTWLMVALGLWRLWAAGSRPDVPWSARTLWGGLALGWGVFNFVEGLIDHQLLGIHHVHPGENQLAWDLGFLASGVALMAIGWPRFARARATSDRAAASDLNIIRSIAEAPTADHELAEPYGRCARPHLAIANSADSREPNTAMNRFL